MHENITLCNKVILEFGIPLHYYVDITAGLSVEDDDKSFRKASAETNIRLRILLYN